MTRCSSPSAQPRPFGGRQDARQHVERDQPLGRVRLAIDREGDADAPEQELRLAAPVLQHVGRQLAKPALEAGIDRPQPAVRARSFRRMLLPCTPPQPQRHEPRVIESDLASFTPKALGSATIGATPALRHPCCHVRSDSTRRDRVPHDQWNAYEQKWATAITSTAPCDSQCRSTRTLTRCPDWRPQSSAVCALAWADRLYGSIRPRWRAGTCGIHMTVVRTAS